MRSVQRVRVCGTPWWVLVVGRSMRRSHTRWLVPWGGGSQGGSLVHVVGVLRRMPRRET